MTKKEYGTVSFYRIIPTNEKEKNKSELKKYVDKREKYIAKLTIRKIDIRYAKKQLVCIGKMLWKGHRNVIKRQLKCCIGYIRMRSMLNYALSGL